jgi:hypothetical protein
MERFDHTTIMQGWEAKALHPVVPGSIVDPHLPRWWGVQQQGAAVEPECRWAGHGTRSVVTGVRVLDVTA